MRRKLAVSATLAVALSVVASSTASRAQAAPRALTIDDAVALALRTNPHLASARERAEAGDVNAASAGRRMLPSIHVSDEAQYWNGPFAVPFGTMSFTVRDQKTNTFVASANQPLLGLFRANEERETLSEQSASDRAQIATTEADLRQTVETHFLHVFEARRWSRSPTPPSTSSAIR